MKEISYPEHLHLINKPTSRLKKKDFAFLESLHPSTAPNKTAKTRTLFRSKKAMQAQQAKAREREAEGLAESLIERSRNNIFRQKQPREERKILTKEEFEKETFEEPPPRAQASSFKRQKPGKAQFDGQKAKRKRRSKPKPKLSIQTDLADPGIRRVATTKHAEREKNVFLHDSSHTQNEYFDSESESESQRLSLAQTAAPWTPGFQGLAKKHSGHLREKRGSQFSGKLEMSPRSDLSAQEAIFDFSSGDAKAVFQKYAALYNFVSEFHELIERGEDPYDVVRKYVDFIQDKKFNDLVEVVANGRYRKNINKALLLERWAVFTTFYIYLDRRMVEKGRFIKSFAKSVFQNMLLVFTLFKIELAQTEGGRSR